MISITLFVGFSHLNSIFLGIRDISCVLHELQIQWNLDESTNIHIHYYRAGESALTWGRNMSSPMMVRVRRSGTHQANNEKLKNLRREGFISNLLVQGKNIFLNVVQTSSPQILIWFCFSRLCTFEGIQFPIWQCQVHKRGTTSKNLTSVENGFHSVR